MIALKHNLSLLVVCLMLWLPLSVQAETAVIVHPSIKLNAISKYHVGRIFLNRENTLPDGTPIEPVDQDFSSPVREAFSRAIFRKSPRHLKAYWTKLIFTSKGRPPKELETNEEVKRWVAENPGAIGYIDATTADESVKVILRF